MTKDEFDGYISRTPLGPRTVREKIMTVCVLEAPRKYENPKKLEKKMNLAGYYLRK